MTYYRLYFLDHAGAIRRAQELHRPGDAEAIQAAQDEMDQGPLELWASSRLVWRSAGGKAAAIRSDLGANARSPP